MAWCLEGLAAATSAVGHLERAANLLGAAAAWRDALGASLSPVARGINGSTVEVLRSALGDGAVRVAMAAGQALPREQIMAEVEHLSA